MAGKKKVTQVSGRKGAASDGEGGKEGGKKARKRKEKRNVPHGVAHIQATFNNT